MAVIWRWEVIEGIENEPSLQESRFDTATSDAKDYRLSKIVLNTFSYSSA